MRSSQPVGPWPEEFPVLEDGSVVEGLAVWSLNAHIEGRTTGARLPCLSSGCPGWFIGVRWETGQLMRICSEGWTYEPEHRSVRVTGGGEISARFVSPKPRPMVSSATRPAAISFDIDPAWRWAR